MITPAALRATLLTILLCLCAAVPAAAVTVRAGDTLGAIAARHGVSVAALAAANGITNPNLVVAGTRLRLPGAAAATPSTTAARVTVRSGDTLGAIAARHGVSVAALAAANGITNPNLVTVGARLRLPGGGAVGATPVAVPGSTVTVRSGDTLGAIAARHGVSVAAMVSANGLSDPNRLSVGRVLRLPPGVAAAGGPGYTTATVSIPRSQVGALIGRYAARHGVDAGLARAIGWQESGFNQHMRSGVGAIGVMQLMPYTADWVGPALLGRRIDIRNVYDNVEGGVAYLAWLQRRTGNRRRTAMAYYQGLRSLTVRGPYDDTVDYARSVLSLAGRV